MKPEIKDFESKMKKTIAKYQEDLAGIRAGRANPAVLDKITVDYFGSPTPINQVSTVSVSDARTIVITPWDATTLKAIERAILASDLGINPQNDGKALRLAFPPLTEERRKDLTKLTAKMGEEVKVAIRNIRREFNDKCKDMKKKSEITEDEQKQAEKSIQDLTDKYIKEIDSVCAAKDKEIMQI